MARRSAGEGSVFVRKSDGRAIGQYRWTDEYGKRHTATVSGATKKEARKKLDEAIDRIVSGGPARDSSAPLGVFVEDWIATALRARLDVEQSTKETYERVARRHLIGTEVAGMRLRDAKARHLELLLAEKSEAGLSASYLRIIHTVLTAVFRIAVRDELLATSPMATVKRPSEKLTEAVYLDVDEASSFLAYLTEDERLLPIVRLLLLTGLRIGELLALRWSDVDLDEGTLSIRSTLGRTKKDGLHVKPTTKTKRVRRISVDETAVGVLRTRRRAQAALRLRSAGTWRDGGCERGCCSDLVFTTDVGGPLEPHNLRNRFRKVAVRAGRPDVHFHTFRHSAASFLLADGVPIKVIQELLGHSSARMTNDIYLHVAKRAKTDAAAKLGAAFGG